MCHSHNDLSIHIYCVVVLSSECHNVRHVSLLENLVYNHHSFTSNASHGKDDMEDVRTLIDLKVDPIRKYYYFSSNVCLCDCMCLHI